MEVLAVPAKAIMSVALHSTYPRDLISSVLTPRSGYCGTGAGYCFEAAPPATVPAPAPAPAPASDPTVGRCAGGNANGQGGTCAPNFCCSKL